MEESVQYKIRQQEGYEWKNGTDLCICRCFRWATTDEGQRDAQTMSPCRGKAAAQGMVLLKNEAETLPLRAGGKRSRSSERLRRIMSKAAEEAET